MAVYEKVGSRLLLGVEEIFYAAVLEAEFPD